VASTMYDMTRVSANGYFDADNSKEKRNANRTALAVQRIRFLEQTARDSDTRVAQLIESNADNLALVSSLKDSLSSAQTSLDNTKDQLAKVTEYESLKQTAYKDGCSHIDNVLVKVDREIFSKMTAEDRFIYSEKLLKLIDELKIDTDNFCSGSKNIALSTEDREKLRIDLYNYQVIAISEYQKKWQQKIFP
ncbi:MAG: hypothetical protein K2M98_04385, partial [Muribaculum sp.]|nr:hypothetical protein [Muribaculum sp.]